jgi:ABC-type multidrug transport system ATPase subunit
MAVPPEVHVGDWRRLVGRLGVSEYETPLQPELPQRRGVAGTSTGEQRRLLIDALLRRRATFYLFDEPFEHVSPAAKGTLNGLLRERASESVVIVATNQGRAAERVAGEGENVLRLLGGGEWIVEGAA